jgi:hypothetical protein
MRSLHKVLSLSVQVVQHNEHHRREKVCVTGDVTDATGLATNTVDIHDGARNSFTINTKIT